MFLRAVVAAVVVAAVSELAARFPRLGALLLTLPVVSIVAFVAVWQKEQQLSTVSRLARETLVLVPLGLPFFVPLALSERLGLGFWTAFAAGVVLASMTIGLWFWFGHQPMASPD
jgi:hypothetical protein